MDLSKLSRGDQVIGASGIALLIFSFFSWLGVKVGSGSVSAEASKSAWGFTLTLFAVLIGIAMVVVVVLKMQGVSIPKPGNFTWGQVLLVAGAVVFAFVIIKVIAGVSGVPSGVGISKTRKIGAYLGVLASAGLLVGGFFKFQEDKAGGGAPPAA